MKIRRNSHCDDSHFPRLHKIRANQCITGLTGLTDITPKDVCLIIELRSYDWHLEELSRDKVPVLCLRTAKLSMLNGNRQAKIIDGVEVCVP